MVNALIIGILLIVRVGICTVYTYLVDRLSAFEICDKFKLREPRREYGPFKPACHYHFKMILTSLLQKIIKQVTLEYL